MQTISNQANGIMQAAQALLSNAKAGAATDAVVAHLKAVSIAALKNELQDDAAKKAFWINVYNGFTQVTLQAHPEWYRKRHLFFTARRYLVAGIQLSLDDIEHGILRRSKIKWSFGYLSKIKVPDWEKALRVDTLDCRIHFALNCGARSCPPIRFYRPERIDQQLDLATRAYLENEVEYNNARNVVQLPALMHWFRADFGGKEGMMRLLKKHHLLSQHSRPRVLFKQYNWALTLNNYKTNVHE